MVDTKYRTEMFDELKKPSNARKVDADELNEFTFSIKYKPEWTIGRFKDPTGSVEKASKKGLTHEQLYVRYSDKVKEDIDKWAGNSGLDEGLNELCKLIATTGATKWDNTNAYLGVGTSSQAVAPHSDTGLIGTAVYVGMDATYPLIGGTYSTVISWKSTYGSAVANQAWEEYSLSNTNSNSGKNLNRALSSKGTKGSGETWTLQLDCTFS